MYNKYISTNRITTHHTLLCRTGHHHLNEDWRQAQAYPRQRLSRISFRQAYKAYEDDYHHKYIHFQQEGNLQYAFMQMIVSPHKITSSPYYGGVIIVSNNTHNIMPGFRMLAFKLWRGEVHSKTFESYNPPSKFLFSKIFK